VKRDEFLRNACLYGVCGCFGASLLTSQTLLADSSEARDDDTQDWRIDFMQKRYRELLRLLQERLDTETLIGVLNELGKKCGDDFAVRFKNDPEGFFTFIKSMWADTVEHDIEKGTITVNEKVRNTCNCPFVKGKEAPAILCNCSLGTQQRIYESLFGREVKVTLNKSVLHGDERCSFTIQLL
jgi:hypothetical protein